MRMSSGVILETDLLGFSRTTVYINLHITVKNNETKKSSSEWELRGLKHLIDVRGQ